VDELEGQGWQDAVEVQSPDLQDFVGANKIGTMKGLGTGPGEAENNRPGPSTWLRVSPEMGPMSGAKTRLLMLLV